MIFDRMNLHEPYVRRTGERGDETFEFRAQFNPIDEPDRIEVEKRIAGDFREALKQNMDKHYGVDEGHKNQ